MQGLQVTIGFFTAMDMEPNYSVYLTYAHDVSNAIFIHSVLNMYKQRLTPR
jgi:hypothetical protein